MDLIRNAARGASVHSTYPAHAWHMFKPLHHAVTSQALLGTSFADGEWLSNRGGCWREMEQKLGAHLCTGSQARLVAGLVPIPLVVMLSIQMSPWWAPYQEGRIGGGPPEAGWK